MNRQDAIKLVENKWWLTKTDREIAEFQLKEDLLCMPFDIFHKAVESALGRPVWTYEFANTSELLAELHGENKPRTMTDIIQKAQDLMDLMGDKPVIIVEIKEERKWH